MLQHRVMVGKDRYIISKTVTVRNKRYNYVRGTGTSSHAKAKSSAKHYRSLGYLAIVRIVTKVWKDRAELAYFVYRRKK